MSKILKTALWSKFIAVVVMFGISFALNFFIFATTDDKTSYYLLLFGKPVLVLCFVFLLNLLFHFPGKIKIPNLIPSTFLVLSFLVFVDLGFLVWKYFELFSTYTSFWVIYGILFGICSWNLQKYVRAFTVGV